MYKAVEEKPIQKTTDKIPFYKKLSWPVLILIPTILLILLSGAIMGAIAGFISTSEILETIDDGAIQITELKKNEQATVEAKSKKIDSEEKKKNPENVVIESDKINKEIIFKVQILSSDIPLSTNSPKFKGIKNIWEYKDGVLYKYTVGNNKDLKSASELQSELRKKGFGDAFVVVFQNGKRIPVRKALKNF
jgi:hypothetical protein